MAEEKSKRHTITEEQAEKFLDKWAKDHGLSTIAANKKIRLIVAGRLMALARDAAKRESAPKVSKKAGSRAKAKQPAKKAAKASKSAQAEA